MYIASCVSLDNQIYTIYTENLSSSLMFCLVSAVGVKSGWGHDCQITGPWHYWTWRERSTAVCCSSWAVLDIYIRMVLNMQPPPRKVCIVYVLSKSTSLCSVYREVNWSKNCNCQCFDCCSSRFRRPRFRFHNWKPCIRNRYPSYKPNINMN